MTRQAAAPLQLVLAGMGVPQTHEQMIKRAVDVLVVSLTLPAWGSALAVVSLLVLAMLGWPILFRQARAGKADRSFTLVKFRTMTEERDASGRLLPDCRRLTGFGRFLRASSLDELPTLWNVLKGDMSLVGPRPLLMEYLPLYSPEQARRQHVRPGITGWAQVNGRNALTWEEKFELDVWYVDNRTLLLDLKILWMTARAVLLREGISAEGEATMPRFQGNPGQE